MGSLFPYDEWEEYFDQYKAEIQALQNEINRTDKEIDTMVYTLYGLTDEENKDSGGIGVVHTHTTMPEQLALGTHVAF